MIATARSFGATLLERIGNTPLINLERLTAHMPGIHIVGKAEWANPGGSVKDRAAAAIVLDAQKRGLLEFHQKSRGRGLLDATSGNTGIAYAMLGAALGFPVTLCVPSNVSPERKHILDAYGAQVIWTDPADGSDGAIRTARALAAAADPDRAAARSGAFSRPRFRHHAPGGGGAAGLAGCCAFWSDRSRDLGAAEKKRARAPRRSGVGGPRCGRSFSGGDGDAGGAAFGLTLIFFVVPNLGMTKN